MSHADEDQSRDGRPVPRLKRRAGTSASCRLPTGTAGTDHGYGETRPRVERGEWDQSAGSGDTWDQGVTPPGPSPEALP